MTARATSDPVRRYLVALEGALRARRVPATRILEEVRAHLEDKVAALIRQGLLSDDARGQAVAALGDPELLARRFQHTDHWPLGLLVAGVSTFTAMATAFLMLSLLAVRPPRASYLPWLLVTTLFAGQGVLTVLVIRVRSSGAVLLWTASGAVVVAALGAWWVKAALTGQHFEGYELILGSLALVQSALMSTWLALSARRPTGLPGGRRTL